MGVANRRKTAFPVAQLNFDGILAMQRIFCTFLCPFFALQFSFDITDSLRPTGQNELLVGVFDPTTSAGQIFCTLHLIALTFTYVLHVNNGKIFISIP